MTSPRHPPTRTDRSASVLPQPAVGLQFGQGGAEVGHPVHKDRALPHEWGMEGDGAGGDANAGGLVLVAPLEMPA